MLLRGGGRPECVVFLIFPSPIAPVVLSTNFIEFPGCAFTVFLTNYIYQPEYILWSSAKIFKRQSRRSITIVQNMYNYNIIDNFYDDDCGGETVYVIFTTIITEHYYDSFRPIISVSIVNTDAPDI